MAYSWRASLDARPGRLLVVSGWAVVVACMVVPLLGQLGPSDVNQFFYPALALVHGQLGGAYWRPAHIDPNVTYMTSPPGFFLVVVPYLAVSGLTRPDWWYLFSLSVTSTAFLAWTAVRLLRTLKPAAPVWQRQAVAMLVAISLPVHFGTVLSFHPEDLVATGLVLLAIEAALDGRTTRVGVLVALAVLTRQWAILPVVPVLVHPAIRIRRAAAIACGVTLVACAPFAASNLHGFLEAMKAPITGINSYSFFYHVAWLRRHAWAVSRVAPMLLVPPAAAGFWRLWRSHVPSPSAVLGAAMAMSTVRPLFDTYPLPYYLLPTAALLFVSAMSDRRGGRRLATLATAVLFQFVLEYEWRLPWPFGKGVVIAWELELLYLAAVVIGLWIGADRLRATGEASVAASPVEELPAEVIDSVDGQPLLGLAT